MLYYVTSVINGTPVYIALVVIAQLYVVDPFMNDNRWAGCHI